MNREDSKDVEGSGYAAPYTFGILSLFIRIDFR